MFADAQKYARHEKARELVMRRCADLKQGMLILQAFAERVRQAAAQEASNDSGAYASFALCHGSHACLAAYCAQ
jgi:hypothetical protein